MFDRRRTIAPTSRRIEAPTTSSEAKIDGTSKVEPATSMTFADSTVAGNNLGNPRSDEPLGGTAAIGGW
jgi:hypothetical protein